MNKTWPSKVNSKPKFGHDIKKHKKIPDRISIVCGNSIKQKKK